mgnify:FL=1
MQCALFDSFLEQGAESITGLAILPRMPMTLLLFALISFYACHVVFKDA